MDFLLVMGMGWLKNGFGSFGDGLVDLFLLMCFIYFFYRGVILLLDVFDFCCITVTIQLEIEY